MRLPIAFALLVSLTGNALAQTPGVHLSWSECLPKGGTRDLEFTCGTVDGSETLLFGFSPDAPAPQMIGLEARIDVSTVPPCGGPGCPGPVLPSWWQFQAGGCRTASLTFSLDYSHPPYSIGTGCTDPWHLNGSGGFFYEYPSSLAGGAPSTAVLRMVAAVPSNAAVALVPGTEYYAFRFVIDNLKTVGLPSEVCDGCCTPMYLLPVYLKIYEPVGVGDFTLNGTDSDAITWQGQGGLCGPTPAMRPTWGMVKSLYR